MRRVLGVAMAVLALGAFAAPAEAGDRSEVVALSLSAGVTAGSLGAAVLISVKSDADGLAFVPLVGAFFGPSIGRWYAGDSAGRTLGLRTLGLGVMAGGFAIAVVGSDDHGIPDTTGMVVLGAGIALTSATAIVDIVQAPRAAARYNARRRAPVVTVAPWSDGRGVGVALAGAL